ncbi:MAG: phospho-sugar mutase, partial [Coprococcus sp.]
FIDEDEIVDRFYKEIELSAGGMSGIIGAGTNRMNIYTIRKTVQGLSNYINAQERENCSVAIAFDSRSMSSEFAKEAALCLNANGIKTYIFPSLRPAPELSFAIRHLKCIAGIVVTAGHKSSEYNGLKLYWEEGTQITPQHNKNIRTEIEKIENYDEINTVSYEDAVKSGLYKEISEEVDNLYIEQIKSQSIHPELIRKETENISIVYTPLNGAGNVPVRRILKEMGFKNVHVVKEQEEPDGTFPTFVYPNPDDEDAWKLALELAKEKNADLVLATDSDSDRLGVYAKDVKTGEYKKFTGNMSGILIADYIFRERTAKGNMSKKQAMVKSIVTTKMAVPVCKKYNIKLVEVLPGFRYIGERMMQLEQDNTYNYVFGMEENYGCLAGTYAGDKDACEAALMLCEAAAYYKSKDMTLCDAMDSLYKEYGYYKEYTETLTLKGMSGAAKIEALMEEYRSDPPKTIGGYNVLYVRDYQTGLRTSTVDGNKKKMKLSKSNIVFFELENDAWCCVRPLKSEQKIKYYIGVKEDTEKKAEEQLEKVRKCIVGGK